MSANDDMKAIVANLRQYHCGKWVNCAVAVGSLEPRAFMFLDTLVESGVIERKYINGLPLVRYTNTSFFKPTIITTGDKQQ